MSTRRSSTSKLATALAFAVIIALSYALLAFAAPAAAPQAGTPSAGADQRLQGAYRFEREQWIYVHLQGPPSTIGYQHGYLLAKEIEDGFKTIQYRDTHRTKRDWDFFRKVARETLWPKIDDEYRQELQGIVDGLNSAGVKLDLWDIVALNAFEEVPDYYVPLLDEKQKTAAAPKLVAPGNCSAFVATGSWTRDKQIVIAHNNWTNYPVGARWRVMFDIVPQKGARILMDGFPGVIASDDDFGITSNGLMITETTITGFKGFDPTGKPEFVRARKAMQYANSIDEYVSIMLDGNNGGYANDWLIGDRKTGEIARFELGLKHHRVWRTKDGYFVGSNFPSDPELIKDETNFDVRNEGSSPNARQKRWEDLMRIYKGKIDVDMAQKFLGDHWDSYMNREDANERTLCGHNELSPRGIPEWEYGPFMAGGTVQGKATNATLAKQMTLRARHGHNCGQDFKAAEYLKAHPEYQWEKPVLIDMIAGPWAEFHSGQTK